MTLFAYELTYTDSTRLVIVQPDLRKAEIKAAQLFPALTLRSITRLGIFRETDLVPDSAVPATEIKPAIQPVPNK